MYSYSRRTRPRTNSGPIVEDKPPHVNTPASLSVPPLSAPAATQNITSPSTLFQYITSGQPLPSGAAGAPAIAPAPTPLAPTVAAPQIAAPQANVPSAQSLAHPHPHAAPVPAAAQPTSKPAATTKAAGSTASTLAAKAAAAQMLVDQVKRAEQLLVKERDRTVAAHNQAIANAQAAGVTVSNTPIVDVSTARKLQQQRKASAAEGQHHDGHGPAASPAAQVHVVAGQPSSAVAAAAAAVAHARPVAAAAKAAVTAAAAAPPVRQTAAPAANAGTAASATHRHEHAHHTPVSAARKAASSISAATAHSTHSSVADEALHIKNKRTCCFLPPLGEACPHSFHSSQGPQSNGRCCSES